VKSADDAVQIFRSVWDTNKMDLKEQMYAILLNRRNEVNAVIFVSEGSLSGTVFSPMTILQATLLTNSSNVIIAHNHPSGNLKPSEADLMVALNLKNGAKLLDIQLMDSLILTTESYYSMADADQLN
jgi:DNA repair protein RadC